MYPSAAVEPSQFGDEAEVIRQISRFEAWHMPARVVGAESVVRGNRARQKAAAKRAIGDKPDAEPLAERKNGVLDVA